jgi:hypothetical protein
MRRLPDDEVDDRFHFLVSHSQPSAALFGCRSNVRRISVFMIHLEHGPTCARGMQGRTALSCFPVFFEHGSSRIPPKRARLGWLHGVLEFDGAWPICSVLIFFSLSFFFFFYLFEYVTVLVNSQPL